MSLVTTYTGTVRDVLRTERRAMELVEQTHEPTECEEP